MRTDTNPEQMRIATKKNVAELLKLIRSGHHCDLKCTGDELCIVLDAFLDNGAEILYTFLEPTRRNGFLYRVIARKRSAIGE